MANKPKPAGDENAAGGGGKKKGLIMVGGGVFLLLALGIGGWLMFAGKSPPPEGEEGSEPADGKAKASAPIYLALEPAFVVNLADTGSNRYLQVEVQVMARSTDTIDAVQLHMPVIRNQLLLLFAQQTTETLRDRESREALQAKALTEIQVILKKEKIKTGLEALYFTSFVTQ